MNKKKKDEIKRIERKIFISYMNYAINYYKFLLLIAFCFVKFYYNKNIKFYISEINKNYDEIKINIDLNFVKYLNNKINIGIYSYGLKNGGRARISSILINYLYQIKIFNIYLFTKLKKLDDEYLIPKDVKREVIGNSITKIISKYKIDILIYNLDDENEINKLNNMKKPKIIYYQHSSFFFFLYNNYTSFLSLYKEYQNSKYVVSLVSLENNYIFKYWGINSILMTNFITYDFNLVVPSNLMSKTILMIGRGYNKLKRFKLGIYSMEYIIKEDSLCKMNIISNVLGAYDLQNLIYNLNLENQIKFVGFTLIPEIYFKNASIHIFPTISESFGLALCETKIYGIPNILVGLDYVQISEGGTIIIYDDSPESIAKESIKILNNEKYRKLLGKKARNSMKKFNNQLLFYRWIKLILSIFHGENYFNEMRIQNKKINFTLEKILNNQIKLLKKRNTNFYNISINEILNFSNLYKYKKE